MYVTIAQIYDLLNTISTEKLEITDRFINYLEALNDVKKEVRKLKPQVIPEIIYCKNCKNCNYNPYSLTGTCDLWNKEGIQVKQFDYCSFAEKR